MTRCIRETCRMFKEAHPDTAIGQTKFYSLRPKCVMPTPTQEVCVCVYCANVKLAVCALEYSSGQKKSAEDFCDRCLCSPFFFTCELGECPACPTVRALTLTDLGIPEDKEICDLGEG